MEQKTVSKLIRRDMTIGEVVQNYPSLAEVLMESGVHCVGCGASYYETLEQGLAGHGKSDKEIDSIIKKLNQSIPKESGSSDKLIITERAAKKLEEILKKNHKENMGLRIKVEAGGCSGYQYGFELEEKKGKDDSMIKVNSVKFFVDKESMTLLKGAKVDYVDALTGAGFKISNPNAKSTCSCGQSFR